MRSLEKRSVFSGVDEDKNMRMKKKHVFRPIIDGVKQRFWGEAKPCCRSTECVTRGNLDVYETSDKIKS